MGKLLVYEPVAVARMFLYVREAQTQGQNRGRRVEGLTHWALGEFGQSWCGYFALGLVLDVAFQGDGPFPRTQEINGNTAAALAYARAQGWEVESPEAGDLIFSVREDGTAHHVALCTETPDIWPSVTVMAIAGNTSEDGASSNGDRVAERSVSTAGKVYVRYPRE